ncbi:MAG: glutamine-hydrolyzing carbamoyl-phosphate synthase small subunit [Phycisphaerae bacterium]|jgi:carbamoyl-phosphate synthase small subunit
MSTDRPAKLALEDGTVFTGTAVGVDGTRAGEVVFNTGMTGYQEVFTDPSYCGQIVTMTFPLLGNYGVNAEDFEAARPYAAGVVLKELPRRPSNCRASASLAEFFERHQLMAVTGVDTRAVTRHIRVCGALRGVLSTEVLDDLELVRQARAATPMSGANLVADVTPSAARPWSERLHALDGRGPTEVAHASRHIVVLDCGIKHNILRHLAEQGCRLTVVPANASTADIGDLRPDALLIGNGPGDPAAVTAVIEMLRRLLGRLPIFGICLGHQLLALALGASTYKLRFGHHGVNVPVLNRLTGCVEITSQNHGFAVDAASLERVGGTPTHVNLNDDSLEGFVHAGHGIAAVQFHPEANPGPHDAGHVLASFARTVAAGQPLSAAVFAGEDRPARVPVA